MSNLIGYFTIKLFYKLSFPQNIFPIIYFHIFFGTCEIGTFNCTRISPHKTWSDLFRWKRERKKESQRVKFCRQKIAQCWKERRKLRRPVSIHNVCLAFCANCIPLYAHFIGRIVIYVLDAIYYLSRFIFKI